MDKNFCKICDFGDLEFGEKWYCEYWSCPIGEVEDCSDRQIDGMGGYE